MTTTNVVTDGETVTVTIKYGKSYEETWAVFKGSVQSVRRMIVEYFGVDESSITEITTHELVVNMTNVAHGGANAAAVLGGTVIPASEAGAKPVQTAGGNPWAGLEDGAPKEDWPAIKPEHEEEEMRLLNIIASASSVPELQKKVWVDNRAGFDKYPTVQAAYKTRGKELSK